MSDFTITVDGRTVECNEGEMMLTAALRAGIEIPNLCHAETLRPYGSCSLCVVEVEGNRRLVRSCATKAAPGMVVRTDTPRVMASRKMAMELLMADHSGQCVGPCTLACPAGTDAQGYVKRIAEGDDRGAVALVKETNPLPASIGRVCPHPCEGDCRRGRVEEPLSIAFLKAFAADNDLASDNPWKPEVAPETGKRVAVVGGGPAGLAAAYRLRTLGHTVAVYDAAPEMGGMLRYGIPEYRLPKAVLAREVKAIADMGVAMVNNMRIGEGMALAQMREWSDAVLLAVGAWSAWGVGCPGDDLEGVLSGIEFLRAVNEGEAPDFSGKSVAVVGGGNTAMDACRTAVRCGAEHVYVVYRRTRAEAPANDVEIAEAIEEGVDFRFLTNPAEIEGADGRVCAIRLQVMELGEPDASGRRRPVPVEGEFATLDVNYVIAAIGQKVVAAGLDGVELTSKGTLSAADDMSTNLEGVFAAGDATNRGAGIAIEAIAEGNRAADAIHAYLSGEPAPVASLAQRYGYLSEREPDQAALDAREKVPRAVMPCVEPEIRKGTFDEVIKGFSEEEARAEAARCLECGCHDFANCRLVRYANVQPIDPGRLEGGKHPAYREEKLVVIERDQGKCILCSQCVRVCREVAGRGVLGLVGRGNATVVAPEFEGVDIASVCGSCKMCAYLCPTGALRIL